MKYKVPVDQLPNLGDWDGPIHGELGVLVADSERLQCHACGRWYRSLASHAAQAHQLLADEYRAIFGLKATHGLVGLELQARLRTMAAEVFQPYWPRAGELGRTLTAQRSETVKGQKRRLESKLNPVNQALARAAAQKGQETHQARLQDPSYKAAWRKHLSIARGGRITRRCVICRTSFEATPSLVRSGRGKTCGEACLRELMRRKLLARRRSPEFRARVAMGASAWGHRRGRQEAERLRSLPEGRFLAISDRDRKILSLFYGLEDGRPVARQEIGDRFGLSRTQIGNILRRLRHELQLR